MVSVPTKEKCGLHHLPPALVLVAGVAPLVEQAGCYSEALNSKISVFTAVHHYLIKLLPQNTRELGNKFIECKCKKPLRFDLKKSCEVICTPLLLTLISCNNNFAANMFVNRS